MSRYGIHALSDQNMIGLALFLDVVVERSTGRVHGKLAKELANRDEHETGEQCDRVEFNGGAEESLDGELDPTGERRHAVLDTMVEKERVGGHFAVVVECRENELAHVKEAQ